MQHRSTHRKWIFSFAAILIALMVATPALADYIGPQRTVTETTSACKVVLNECKYVEAKDDYIYKRVNDWSCSNESKPWQAYPSDPPRSCSSSALGEKYWSREDNEETQTVTYPPATISGSLQNCTLQNGWCITVPQLSLTGYEPVAGYSIIGIEGTRNGQNFGCVAASCDVSLSQGVNDFTYWALSSFTDSSSMGTLTAKVDSQLPTITGALIGTAGSNGWYTSAVSFNGSAGDATSGLASFTCTLDSSPLGSCNSITVSTDGLHTLVLTARDNAGLTRTLTQNASIDTRNPALAASLSGTLGSNNWYTAASLSASASDPAPGSGLSVFEYNLDSGGWTAFPASGTLQFMDGSHAVDLRAIDKAGRTVASSKSFSLDTVPPNVTIAPTGTLGLNNWYTTSLTLTASANDATSGMDVFDYSLDHSAWQAYVEPLILSDGTHTFSLWAQDAAGLVTQVDHAYQVDTRAPQIAGSLSGTPGTNGWYISDVTLSASPSDPLPGSGMDAFTYTLNGSAQTLYTDPLLLSDGQHTVKFNAIDKAGLTYSIEQSLQVDTTHPSLKIDTALPNWVMGNVTLKGTAEDGGSGLLKVELSTDGGQTWHFAKGLASWTYTWDTLESPNGLYQINVRITDFAGLTTQQTLSVGVDNRGPKISLPDSWFQWDAVMLDIWDNHSGLSEAYVEVIDPEGRWPKRVIRLDPAEFPLEFKWDRRFGDDTIAPLGIYDVKVIALDSLGNMTRSGASVKILLDILPAGPTATLQPYSRSESTPTPLYTVTPVSSPMVTPTAIISVFGAIEPTAQTTPTPEILPTPRAAPGQTGIMDWLQSFFIPSANNEEQVTEIGPLHESADSPQSSATDSVPVLWGTAAAAAIGAATAYAQEEKRRREEEKARQEALEARKEERREKLKERKIAKMEAIRAQERAWEEARREQEQLEEIKSAASLARTNERLERLEAREEAIWVASQTAVRQRDVDNKKAKEEEKKKELEAGLAAYYNAIRQSEKEDPKPAPEPNWWEKTKSFVSEKIIEPVNTNIYEPYIKPRVELRKQMDASAMTWLDKNFYQPYIQPVIDRTKEHIKHESAWINEHIIEPYVKPATTKLNEVFTNTINTVKEKVYQPYIKPAVDKTIQTASKEIEWLNEKVYKPYIQPAVEVISEKVYQPYIKPTVDKTVELVKDNISWINENIYQPVFAPVVNDINQHIYQPLANKTSDWWKDYGEWVHGALDAVGFIPGLGEIADGLNGVIYLAEGRYLEASLSAMSMIPLIGDLGKAGKWTLTAAETMVEKVAKEVAGDGIQKATKELLEENTEKFVKESLEEGTEKAFKEVGEDVAEGPVKEVFEEAIEKTVNEAPNELKEDALTKKLPEKDAEPDTTVVEDKVAEETTNITPEQVNETQLVDSLRKQYGDEMVDQFLPLCEKYGINPHDVVTNPPSEGQSLSGWVLGIDNPANPINHPHVNLDLSDTDLNKIRTESTKNPDSKIVVLGYGNGCDKPYYELGKEIDACHLSLSNDAWTPFQNAQANFWSDVNAPFLEKAIEERKIFLFNIDSNVIEDPANARRFSLPELRLLKMETDYVQVPVGEYTAFVPVEQVDTYMQDLPSKLFESGE